MSALAEKTRHEIDELVVSTEKSAAPESTSSRLTKSLSLRIFAALVLGGLLGGSGAHFDVPGLERMVAIAEPVGRLWLDALTMTVVPLVFSLLVTGVASAAQGASTGGAAKSAILWFTVLLLVCCALGAIIAELLLSGWPVVVRPDALGARGSSPAVAPAAEWVSGLFPMNPIKAAADNAMVPLVVFALLFGFAATRIPEALGQSLSTFFQAIVEAMLVIVHWVLWLAPIGVLALAFTFGARLGVSAAGILAQYLFVVVACCLSAAALAAALAMVIGRLAPIHFLKAALPAQTVAISTQSSLASLPAMIAAAPGLRIDRASISVVLPLAVSLFRAASAAANIAVAVYLAHLHAVPLSPATMAIGAVTAAAVSVAAVGLPAQVSFFATIAPVCAAMGIPVVLLPVLLAIETIPDIFRTFGNVTADLAVARLAGTRAHSSSADNLS